MLRYTCARQEGSDMYSCCYVVPCLFVCLFLFFVFVCRELSGSLQDLQSEIEVSTAFIYSMYIQYMYVFRT